MAKARRRSSSSSPARKRAAKAPSLVQDFLREAQPKLTPDALTALLRTQRLTVAEIAKELHSKPRQVTELIAQMQKQGRLIYAYGKQWGVERVPHPEHDIEPYLSRDDNTFLFGVISDTHLASKYERLDVLNDMYDKFAQEGVDRVLHAGNWIEGEARFNRHEILRVGMDQQIQYLVENYPQRKGLVTYAVTGDDHEGWFCFEMGAEILTRDRGWVRFDQLTGQEWVATRTATGVFEWQVPSRVIRQAHRGPMVRLRHRSIDVLVTPEHRFEVEVKSSMHGEACTRVMTAQRILDEFKPRCIGIPRTTRGWLGRDPGQIGIDRQPCRYENHAGIWHPEALPAQDLAVLCAWYAAEGWTDANRVSIGQSAAVNAENQALIASLVERLGGRVSRDPRGVAFSSGDLAHWLRENCGSDFANKRLPRWVLDMPGDTLEMVFDALIRGDGHDRGEGCGWKYYTGSEMLQAQVAEIAQKLGLTVSYAQGKSCINVHIGEVHQVAYLFQRPTLEDYAGEVVCVAVPNERIFVRNRGKTFWSMNSQREGIDIGRHTEHVMLTSGRTDWVNCGYMEAYIPLRNTHTGQATQLLLQHPGGGCFDDRAEIMTRDRGWVKFAELRSGEAVATMTPADHEFQWQVPTHITNEPYSGSLYEFRHRSLTCRVTPQHRFLVRRYDAQRQAQRKLDYPTKSHRRHPTGWHVQTADEIVASYARQRFQLPTACAGWKGNLLSEVVIPRREPKRYASTPIQHFAPLPVLDAARLLGWFVTAGAASKSRKSFTITQSQRVNPQNHKEILDLLRRIGCRPRVGGQDAKDIVVSSVELTDWLVSQCGNGSRNKRLPDWLKDQPAWVLQELLRVLIAGDGWNAKNAGSFGYKTISRRLADDVTEIAQKLGYGVSAGLKGETWSLSLRAHQNNPTINQRPTKSNYNGRIYCCTVPNGLIYVRVDGRAFWSHNSSYAVSYVIQKIVESFEGGEKPAVLVSGHYHKLWAGDIRNVWCVMAGCTQDQTSFMRKKRISAHVGGLIVKLTQDPQTGAIVACRPEMFRYFNKGYYNRRWSHSHRVQLPERKLR